MSGTPLKPKPTEKETQATILAWLAAKRIFHWRNNTGGFMDANKHFYRFGALGSPDIFAIVGGRAIGIEVKGHRGQQSEAQKEFEARMRKAGGLYILARSIEDVEVEIKHITN